MTNRHNEDECYLGLTRESIMDIVSDVKMIKSWGQDGGIIMEIHKQTKAHNGRLTDHEKQLNMIKGGLYVLGFIFGGSVLAFILGKLF